LEFRRPYGPSSRSIQQKGYTCQPNHTGKFQSPLSSFLAFVPLKIFNLFAVYSNMYAHDVMAKQKDNKISGSRWDHDIDLQEMMTFWGILFKMVLRPTPGQPYTSCWDDKMWHPYTEAMSLRRFQQIRSVLHFNNPNKAVGSNDAVFKARQPRNVAFRIQISVLLFLIDLLILVTGPSITKHS
jgi:Transposase IS4